MTRSLPYLRAAGRGHIVNVSSVGGRGGTPGLGAYQAAKWAVNGFTEVLVTEVASLGIRVTAVEPGGMQTDWARSSMHVPEPSPPYQPVIGALTALFANGSADALGDPVKVAAAIVQITELDDPPVRVLLGSDAIVNARAAADRLAANDRAWESLSRSTDRDGATDVQRDPLNLTAAAPETVVRRFIDEVVNGGDLAAVDQLWAPDLTWHGGSLGEIHGIDAFRQTLADSTQRAFGDMHLDVADTIVAGNKVVVRFTNSGTHIGPFLGATPTGKHAQWLGIGIYTVVDGRITDAWFGEDILGALQQLGSVRIA